MSVAIIGGGWAGLAAAVAATQCGHEVTLLEATRALGGRARTLAVRLPDGGGEALLDNGQHILIGAYLETLRLMEQVGVRLDETLLRLPLVLQRPDGSGIALPDWPAPWDAVVGHRHAPTAGALARQGCRCCAASDRAGSLQRLPLRTPAVERLADLCSGPLEQACGNS